MSIGPPSARTAPDKGAVRMSRPSPNTYDLPNRALSILIVARDALGAVDAQLDTLRVAARYRAWQVIVFDNASTDGTADRVAERHPWAKLLRSPVDLGFAAAANRAALEADGALLLLLDPHARVQPAAIAKGVARMLVNPPVGVAGGRLFDDNGVDLPSAHLFPSVLNDALDLSGLAARHPRSRLFGRSNRTWADPDTLAKVDWVPRTFALIRHDVFQYLDGFDARFFDDYDEADLCGRVWALGFEVHYWPDLRIRCGSMFAADAARRRGGARGLDGGHADDARTLSRMRSELLYYRKHHSGLTAWSAYRLETGWLAWQAMCDARRASPPSIDAAQAARERIALFQRAWRETQGGRVSPPVPHA